MASALETPMMKQFLAIKARYPDAIVFYRMGDFYEMFLDDAELAAPLLDIALTTRDKGKSDAVPMCGIPVHSADQYIKQLAGLGHRVAICEQVEDPKQLGGRRLVKRDVVEVVTPGLVGDPDGLDGRSEVSLAALDLAGPTGSAALSVLDASTGDFRATSVEGGEEDGLPLALLEELERVAPREILVPLSCAEAIRKRLVERLPDCAVTAVEDESFLTNGVPVEPEGFAGLSEDLGKRPAAALLRYLGANQPSALAHAPRIRRYELLDTVVDLAPLEVCGAY